MKTINIILTVIVFLFALYGAIILTRKIMLPEEEQRKTKKELGKKFWVEPFRRRKCDCNLCSQDWANANNYGCDYSVACENACN